MDGFTIPLTPGLAGQWDSCANAGRQWEQDGAGPWGLEGRTSGSCSIALQGRKPTTG